MDQILRVEGPGGTAKNPVLPGILALDRELSWSTLVRKGLDVILDEVEAELRGTGQVYQSISAPPLHGEPETRTSPASGKSRKPAHRREHDPLAQGHQSASGSFPELPDLIRAWMHRHKVRSIAAAADHLDVPYHTLRSWSLGTRRPGGFILQTLVTRLLE